MEEITVRAFAEQIGVSPERLLAQFVEAGIEGLNSPDDLLLNEQKMVLLGHLRKSRGKQVQAETQRVTLRRRSISELKVAGSQGRSKMVTIEVRRKRVYVKRAVVLEQEKQRIDEARKLREAEQERERLAERQQHEDDVERKRREEASAQRKAEEARKLEAARQEKENLIRAQEEERRRAEAEARKEEEEEQRRQEKAISAHVSKSTSRAKKGKSISGELHVKTGGKGGRRESRARRRQGRGRVATVEAQHGFERPVEPKQKEVEIPETISVSDLAQRMAVKSSGLIRTLMKLGVMATINQTLDQDTASLAVEEMGHVAKLQAPQDADMALLERIRGLHGKNRLRHPVVTVMGHVDHGKTSLLDYIRSTRVTSKEAGGITQHIGAYHVKLKQGGITFLDTPGHAVFSAMRARGAQVTDLVILVVAADDGVMPQTIEAIDHARAAGVPIVAAINKIDKPQADLERIKTELAQREVVPEEWGGDTQFIPVSAKTGEGVESLLEAILLQAELLELKAPVDGAAQGVVLESSLDKGRGSMATVLVQRGTLKRGDTLLAGCEYGRVRSLLDEQGRQVNSAGPSMPVQVLGLSGVPEAGDEALVVPDEHTARGVAIHRQQHERNARFVAQQQAKPDDLFTQMGKDKIKVFNLLIKADVRGSLEAIRGAVNRFSGEEVAVNVISAGVGAITESDINLAMVSNAVIIAFNVRADKAARRAQQDSGADVRYYSVIYDLIDDVRKVLSGMLSPEVREKIVGIAEVRDVFRSPKFGAVAGSLVTEGHVRRDDLIRVLRDNMVIYEGRLESLRRFKNDIAEVQAGTECGIAVKDYNDVRPGDQIEVYQRIEVDREIEP